MVKQTAGKKDIYFIGVKGVGMTMLAQFLARQGHRVSGSDTAETFMTDSVLRSARIKVYSPFSAKNMPADIDRIVYSSAYNERNNPELGFIAQEARRFKNIPVLPYAVALGEVFNQHYGIAVCGSHGKTTTTAWLGYVLWRAGQRPNVLVGARVPQFRGSSLTGRSRQLVAETDEYQNKLQYYRPRGVILNNIDYDHPDFFRTKAAYVKVFADFLKKIPAAGFLIINRRDALSRQISRHCAGRIISYDLVTGDYGHGADYLAYDRKTTKGGQSFQLAYQGRPLGEFKIGLWGEHNILNALAVIAAARRLGVSWPLIKRHLAGFKGIERRAQALGSYRGALIVDDYAHHPTEIKAALDGLRSRYPGKRLITVFHPHTFTRTKALFSDFRRSFAATDELIILDIYGSAREQQGGVSSRQLAQAVREFNRTRRSVQPVRHIPDIPAAVAYLRRHLKSGHILVLMGAGDVFRIGQKLLNKL
ncbi:MAG: UDP-N-acetylmuramate--L-alanine ligase [Patescibacteria group bacterium]